MKEYSKVAGRKHKRVAEHSLLTSSFTSSFGGKEIMHGRKQCLCPHLFAITHSDPLSSQGSVISFLDHSLTSSASLSACLNDRPFQEKQAAKKGTKSSFVRKSYYSPVGLITKSCLQYFLFCILVSTSSLAICWWCSFCL